MFDLWVQEIRSYSSRTVVAMTTSLRAVTSTGRASVVTGFVTVAKIVPTQTTSDIVVGL